MERLKRRDFMTTVAAAFSWALPAEALANLTCGPFVPPGVQRCEAGIDSAWAGVTAAAVGEQDFENWCWAACIEMVFRHYGFRVPQERIVEETWGTVKNLPAEPGEILANLNRPWVDEFGRPFGVSGDIRSANPVTAAQDLARNMPLIIGTLGHAMVLTALAYDRNLAGNGNVVAAVVRDPWPGNGKRVLSPQEWYNTSLLVRIRVFRR